MQFAEIKAALFALAFALACAGPARAALVLSGPSQVTPGQTFTMTLSLDDAWPMQEAEAVDQVDVFLAYDADVLVFDFAAATGIFLDSGVSVLPSAITTALFDLPRAPFGPGSLLQYQFTVLPGITSGTASISANAVPTMIVGDVGDTLPLAAQLAPATASVQVVPEPSTWLLLAAGVGLLILVPRARRSGLRRQERQAGIAR